MYWVASGVRGERWLYVLWMRVRIQGVLTCAGSDRCMLAHMAGTFGPLE